MKNFQDLRCSFTLVNWYGGIARPGLIWSWNLLVLRFKERACMSWSFPVVLRPQHSGHVSPASFSRAYVCSPLRLYLRSLKASLPVQKFSRQSRRAVNDQHNQQHSAPIKHLMCSGSKWAEKKCGSQYWLQPLIDGANGDCGSILAAVGSKLVIGFDSVYPP